MPAGARLPWMAAVCPPVLPVPRSLLRSVLLMALSMPLTLSYKFLSYEYKALLGFFIDYFAVNLSSLILLDRVNVPISNINFKVK